MTRLWTQSKEKLEHLAELQPGHCFLDPIAFTEAPHCGHHTVGWNEHPNAD